MSDVPILIISFRILIYFFARGQSTRNIRFDPRGFVPLLARKGINDTR